jgi:hypothetical protein
MGTLNVHSSFLRIIVVQFNPLLACDLHLEIGAHSGPSSLEVMSDRRVSAQTLAIALLRSKLLRFGDYRKSNHPLSKIFRALALAKQFLDLFPCPVFR